MANVNAPQALSYGPPKLDEGDLDFVGKYFKGAEQRQKYDLARTFKDGLPMGPDGQPDFAKAAAMLAQRGDTSQIIPMAEQAVAQQQRAALQGALAPGAGAGGPPAPVAPPTQQAPNSPPAAPQREPVPPTGIPRAALPQPALSSAGTDNAGAQTFRAMATELAAGRDVSSIIKNASTALKIDPDASLTPEQEAKFKPLLAKSIAAAQQQGQQAAAPAQGGAPQGAPVPQDRAGGNVATANALAQANGFKDYRTALSEIHKEIRPLFGNPLAKEYIASRQALATSIGSALTGVDAQGNADREFTEKVRQHGASEMTPVKIGVGAFGEELYAVKDPASGGFRIVDPKTGQLGAVVPSGTAPSAPKESSIPAKDLELDRKAGRNVEYLQSLDPEQQGIVRKMANYEMNPTSLSIKGGHRERVLAAVANFDPNYDQKNYLAFSDGLKKFQSGKEGSGVRSFNVGIEHIDQLLELGKALNNGDIPKINELKNWVKQNIGEDGPTNFNGLKAIVGAEIVKAIVGAGGTGEERAAAAKTVSGASSMKQLEGIARTYASAMGAQLGGLQRQYEQSTGRKDFDRLLSPQAIRARDSHNAPSSGGGASGAAKPANDGWTVKEIR